MAVTWRSHGETQGSIVLAHTEFDCVVVAIFIRINPKRAFVFWEATKVIPHDDPLRDSCFLVPTLLLTHTLPIGEAEPEASE